MLAVLVTDCSSYNVSKKFDLTLCLNSFLVFESFMSIGILFHKSGPEYDKEFCPTLVLQKGILKLYCECLVSLTTILGMKISDM